MEKECSICYAVTCNDKKCRTEFFIAHCESCEEDYCAPPQRCFMKHREWCRRDDDFRPYDWELPAEKEAAKGDTRQAESPNEEPKAKRQDIE